MLRDLDGIGGRGVIGEEMEVCIFTWNTYLHNGVSKGDGDGYKKARLIVKKNFNGNFNFENLSAMKLFSGQN